MKASTSFYEARNVKLDNLMNSTIVVVLGMGSKTVSISIEQETLDAVDALVRLGIF
jgi:hypothetical protein